MRLALVCFYCLCVFVYVFYFIATMSFAGYFLSVLFCLLSMLISDSRFDLVWFRLSCDHGWIRSGSVNVRKQQQHVVYTPLHLNLIKSKSSHAPHPKRLAKKNLPTTQSLKLIIVENFGGRRKHRTLEW